jgi:CHAD domain-containing protein
VLERSQLLKKRLRRFTQTFAGLEKGDIVALHRARIASRRLRGMMPLLELESGRARRLGRRLRKVTSRLGRVRELDVLLLLIDELHESRRPHRQALGRVAVVVSKERSSARKRLFNRLPMDELRKVAKRLNTVVDDLRDLERESPRAARAWRWAIDATVVARATRLRDAIATAGAVYLPERLHDVRIASKKLRYAVELDSEMKGVASPDLPALKRAQEILGQMHDRQVLLDRVRQEQASLTLPDLTIWRSLDELLLALEDDCRRLHARYMRGRAGLEAITEKLSAQRRRQTQLLASTRRAG